MNDVKYEIDHSKGRIFHVARVTRYNSVNFDRFKVFVRLSEERAVAAAKRWCDKHYRSQIVTVYEYSPVTEDLPDTEENEPGQWYK